MTERLNHHLAPIAENSGPGADTFRAMFDSGHLHNKGLEIIEVHVSLEAVKAILASAANIDPPWYY